MAKRTKTSKRQRKLIKHLHAKVQHLSYQLGKAEEERDEALFEIKHVHC